MTMTDPIADMLTRIRNANVAMHDDVTMPSSKLKESLAEVLQKEGYIQSFRVDQEEGKPSKTLIIDMKYSEARERVITGIRRVSKPGGIIAVVTGNSTKSLPATGFHAKRGLSGQP